MNTNRKVNFETLENEITDTCFEIYKKYRKLLKHRKRSKLMFFSCILNGALKVIDMIFTEGHKPIILDNEDV